MNLISDAWLPVIRASGKRDKIAPRQIAEMNDPVMELNAPRPDFQGALYQFLIGLLQTCFAPADHEEWLEYWEELPDEIEIRKCFEKVSPAFYIDQMNGPNFMQDFEDFEGEELPIEDLIGGSISDNTRKKNRDLWVKRNFISRVSPYWASIALFNVQTTGVLAWGKHRIGMRGNGPVTTLVIPAHDICILWKKLWLNVLTSENFSSVPGDKHKREDKYIFPWLTQTRKSPNKEVTSPEDGNPLQVFWPMPRRIRLFIEKSEVTCGICGEKIDHFVRSYKRINDGVFYKGWKHPLTPYIRKDKQSFSQPVTGSKISFFYMDWSPLTINGCIDGMECSRSKIISAFQSERSRDLGDKCRIWCFAYGADSASVIRWYDARMPLFSIDEEEVESIRSWVNDLLESAKCYVIALKLALVRAWFNPKIDNSGRETWSHIVTKKGTAVSSGGKAIPDHLSTLHAIEQNFWGDTEIFFYEMLSEIINVANLRDRPLAIYKQWIEHIRYYSIRKFESECFSLSWEDKAIKRVVSAKKFLLSELWPEKGLLADLNKLIKTL